MRKYGLFGYPLEHSFSKKFFTEKFKREGLSDCAFENFESQNIYDLKKIVAENPDLMGLNVTLPYKQDVIPLLDNLDDISQRIGAVNTIRIERFDSPSVNIVGVIKGTDPKLRDEYVLYSSHQDHDGVRFETHGDSIWNGADDNASVSVALLATARAFVKNPGKRSVLFVYHGAEERGLLGSRYHAAHPVVPLQQIVAVLNGDMIGRNNPDSASILGIQPPHKNSSELVDMALAANTMTEKFKLDSIWDRPTHPEGWYFRSDHVPYARLNVPAIEYSTNLHPDYHTVRDEPSRIDYAKLTRMTQWMYLTGWYVANVPKRPGIDPGFKLER